MTFRDIWDMLQERTVAYFNAWVDYDPTNGVGYLVPLANTQHEFFLPDNENELGYLITHYIEGHRNSLYLLVFKKNDKICIVQAEYRSNLGKSLIRAREEEATFIYNIFEDNFISLFPITLREEEWYLIDTNKLQFISKISNVYTFRTEFNQSFLYSYKELLTKDIKEYSYIDHRAALRDKDLFTDKRF